MVAIVVVLSGSEAAPIAASMAVDGPGAIDPHPKGLEREWRRARERLS
jgi:hypothetical protein